MYLILFKNSYHGICIINRYYEPFVKDIFVVLYHGAQKSNVNSTTLRVVDIKFYCPKCRLHHNSAFIALKLYHSYSLYMTHNTCNSQTSIKTSLWYPLNQGVAIDTLSSYFLVDSFLFWWMALIEIVFLEVSFPYNRCM